MRAVPFLFFFIIAGIGYVNTSNIGIGCTVGSPGCAEFMPFGFSGVVTGAAVIFFAYIGFDSVSTHAEEARKPHRDVPIGIIASLIICTVLYILVSAVLTGMVPYRDLAVADPLARALQVAGFQKVGWIVALGASISMAAVILVFQYGQPRIFFAMADDGLFFKKIAAVHPRFKTPYVAISLAALLAIVFVMVRTFEQLSDTFVLGIWPFYALGVAAVYPLRRTRPDLPRSYKTLGYPVTPALFILAVLVLNLPRVPDFGLLWKAWIRGLTVPMCGRGGGYSRQP